MPHSSVAVIALAGVLAGAPALGRAQSPDPDFEVFEAPIAELQDALEAGRVTSAQLVDAYVARIRAYDQAGPELNAILHLNVRARAQAEALDAERAAQGPRGPLHGIPILLKDNFNTADMPTTGGSVALAGTIPPEDATVVRRLREAGAVILGKTNMHEMAYGYTTISSLGGQTRNPYDPSRLPGGSSGGTAAAVAASLAAIGWGTDTCGSIRVPAALNGLYGLRPTKGLTSIAGILPLAHTQDVNGPLARTVEDLAVGLDATVGYDPADQATEELRDRPLPRFGEALDEGALNGARIGILSSLFGDSAEEIETSELVRAALARMQGAGAELIEVEIPDLNELSAGTSVIVLEFKFDLMDYLQADPQAPVKSLAEILDLGLYHNAVEGALRASEAVTDRESPSYLEALARQASLRDALTGFMEARGLDALAYPVVRRPAAPIGGGQAGVNCGLSASSGLPAMAIPAGLTEGGLPVGVQLLGRRFDDARLVGYAYAYERVSPPRRPPPTTPPLR